MPDRKIKQLLKKYGIKPNKMMGQNFLIDESILEKIIAAAGISLNDAILEIGPGLGILTFELAKKAKKVIAIEKDKNLSRILNNELRTKNVKNVEIVNEDALKIFNVQFSIFNKFSMSNYKLVANLPYYITSPVIKKFLETENGPELMVLMVQKEVAERICACPQRQQPADSQVCITGKTSLHGKRAKPGKMSILAIAVQFYAEPEIVSIVPKTSFYPQPKVDSAILRIKPRIDTNKITNINEFDTEKFFKMVRAGFSSKRKFLINNLSRKLKIENLKLKIIFDHTNVGQKIRAEELSVEDWINIYEQIKDNL